MASVPFLKPRLVGKRFSNGVIPLEFLADFAVLSEMIVEVAKWRYLEDHTERQRVPKGFTDGISLELSAIEQGSAILNILLSLGSALLPSDLQAYFLEARNAVVGAVSAAEGDSDISEHMPRKLLGFFDRFGRHLLDGEAIEFPTESGASTARLTRETRRRLVLASTFEEVTEEVAVYGRVPEMDKGNGTFQLELPTGVRLKAPVSPQHAEQLQQAFNGYESMTWVRVWGVGTFNRSNRLQGLATVEHVAILDPLDIGVRLNELSTLKPGWMDGQGVAPSQHGLYWLADMFGSFYPEELPSPYLYPTLEGGIRAEWSLKPYDISLDIDIENGKGYWHTLNLDTDRSESLDLSLHLPEAWVALADRIRQLTEKTA